MTPAWNKDSMFGFNWDASSTQDRTVSATPIRKPWHQVLLSWKGKTHLIARAILGNTGKRHVATQCKALGQSELNSLSDYISTNTFELLGRQNMHTTL